MAPTIPNRIALYLEAATEAARLRHAAAVSVLERHQWLQTQIIEGVNAGVARSRAETDARATEAYRAFQRQSADLTLNADLHQAEATALELGLRHELPTAVVGAADYEEALPGRPA